MRYITVAGPAPRPGFIGRALARFLPRANPDFDMVYETVSKWWLEIDDDAVVRRELAFDSAGKPIAAAPLGRNRGIFVDVFDQAPDIASDVEGSQFEQKWQQFERPWVEANRRQVA